VFDDSKLGTDNFPLLHVKNTGQYYIHNSKIYANAHNINRMNSVQICTLS